MQSHVPAAPKALAEVKNEIIAVLQKDKAQAQAQEAANKVKEALLTGKNLTEVGQTEHLAVKQYSGLTRNATDIDPAISQAIFRAVKPQPNRPSVVIIDNPAGGKIVANIKQVIEGAMTDTDKAKYKAIEKSMATAFGRAQFEAVLNQLQANTDIKMQMPKSQ
jgi:peptidyl-prolyl cis-trans isomerase D